MIKWFEYFTVSSSELLECEEVQQNFKEESGKYQVHIPLSSSQSNTFNEVVVLEQQASLCTILFLPHT